MRTKQTHAFTTFRLEHLILGLLFPGPQHGYRLYHDYQAAFNSIWVIGRSQFYAALAELERSGKLKAHVVPQEDHPPRRVFALTGAGRAQFEAWLREPVTPMRAIRVELIAKLRFYDLLGLDGAAALIDAQIGICRETRGRWQAEVTGIDSAASDPFLQVVYDFRRQQTDFIIQWLEHTKILLAQKSS